MIRARRNLLFAACAGNWPEAHATREGEITGGAVSRTHVRAYRRADDAGISRIWKQGHADSNVPDVSACTCLVVAGPDDEPEAFISWTKESSDVYFITALEGPDAPALEHLLERARATRSHGDHGRRGGSSTMVGPNTGSFRMMKTTMPSSCI